MGKAKKATESVIEVSAVNNKTFLEDLTREELHARRVANVAERARLAEENAELSRLWTSKSADAKVEKATNKMAQLQAKLASLTAENNSEAVVEATPVSEALAM